MPLQHFVIWKWFCWFPAYTHGVTAFWILTVFCQDHWPVFDYSKSKHKIAMKTKKIFMFLLCIDSFLLTSLQQEDWHFCSILLLSCDVSKLSLEFYPIFLVSRLRTCHLDWQTRWCSFIWYQVCLFILNRCGDTVSQVQAVFFGPSSQTFFRLNYSSWQLGLQASFPVKISSKLDCCKCKQSANFHSRICKTHCTAWFQVEALLQGTVASLLILLIPPVFPSIQGTFCLTTCGNLVTLTAVSCCKIPYD